MKRWQVIPFWFWCGFFWRRFFALFLSLLHHGNSPSPNPSLTLRPGSGQGGRGVRSEPSPNPTGWKPVVPETGETPVPLMTGWKPVVPETGETPVPLMTGWKPVVPETGETPVPLMTGWKSVVPETGETPVPLMTGWKPVVPHRGRAGFTLVELIVASVVAAMLAGAITITTQGIMKSRNRSQTRQAAYESVYAVTQIMARDVSNLVRSSDLKSVILRVEDDETELAGWERDKLLIFNQDLRPVRTGEDVEPEDGVYEVEYRLDPDDALTGVLWRRRDPRPDEFYDGGGVAVPLATGLMALEIEAFDGTEWLEEYDSDVYGIPYAIRITCRGVIEPDDERMVWARVCVALDRYPLPEVVEELDLFGGDGGGLFGDDGGDGGLFGGGEDDGGSDQGGGSGGGGLFGGGGGR